MEGAPIYPPVATINIPQICFLLLFLCGGRSRTPLSALQLIPLVLHYNPHICSISEDLLTCPPSPPPFCRRHSCRVCRTSPSLSAVLSQDWLDIWQPKSLLELSLSLCAAEDDADDGGGGHGGHLAAAIKGISHCYSGDGREGKMLHTLDRGRGSSK